MTSESLRAAWYGTPIWVLDSWTYTVDLRKSRERGEPPLADEAAKANQVRVRRTRLGSSSTDAERGAGTDHEQRLGREGASMLLVRDGAVLAALCGVESLENEEDESSPRRDVALAVVLAKMVAFIPFRGVRAGNYAGNYTEHEKQGRAFGALVRNKPLTPWGILLCDHDAAVAPYPPESDSSSDWDSSSSSGSGSSSHNSDTDGDEEDDAAADGGQQHEAAAPGSTPNSTPVDDGRSESGEVATDESSEPLSTQRDQEEAPPTSEQQHSVPTPTHSEPTTPFPDTLIEEVVAAVTGGTMAESSPTEDQRIQDAQDAEERAAKADRAALMIQRVYARYMLRWRLKERAENRALYNTGSLYKTKFHKLYDASLRMLEVAASCNNVPPNQDEYAACGTRENNLEVNASWFTACGMTANIALLHCVVDRMLRLGDPEVTEASEWWIDSYVKGALIADNHQSLDLLIRYPPKAWTSEAEVEEDEEDKEEESSPSGFGTQKNPKAQNAVANFFHLSEAATRPVMTRGGRSSLIWTYWQLQELLPATNDEDMWDAEFRQKVAPGAATGSPSRAEGDSSTPAAAESDSWTAASHFQTIPHSTRSQFQTNLVASIVHKKHFGSQGYMNFPSTETSSMLSIFAQRVGRGNSVLLNAGRGASLPSTSYREQDLKVLLLELAPEKPWAWRSVTYSMGRSDTVSVRVEKNGRPQTFSKMEASLKMMELELCLTDKDAAHDESTGWNSLAIQLDQLNGGHEEAMERRQRRRTLVPNGEEDNSSGGGGQSDPVAEIAETVEVRGTRYTSHQMGQKCLSVALAKKAQCGDAYCEWDTCGMLIKPPNYYPSEDSYFQLDVAKREGDADAAAAKETPPRRYTNLDCVIIALGNDAKFLILWVHVGFILWRNHQASLPQPPQKQPQKAPTVRIPWSLVEAVEATVVKALACVGKTLEEVKIRTVFSPPSLSKEDKEGEQQRFSFDQQVIGAGGGKAAVGPSEFVAELTELDCYLIAHTSDERTVLTDVATDDPPSVMRRLIEVLTPARISEKGRRVVEVNTKEITF